MIVAGHQPNYLPWLGFFDKMSKCDIFVIADSVQFVSKEFQNRNRIKTPNGVAWLTVPVKKESKLQPISEVQIANEQQWSKRHLLSMVSSYSRAPYWREYCDFFEETYSKKWTRLIDLNLHLIKGIMDFLDIDAELVMLSSIGVSGKKSDLIIAFCKALGADIYLSGMGSKNYLDLEKFEHEGIKVIFQEFKYPVYPQLWGDFVPNLSVVDYLFCTGGKF